MVKISAMVYKTLVVGVIILFIGLATSPIIYADNVSFSSKDEIVELTIEIYGIDDIRPFTVNLTQKEVDEVEKFSNSIRNRLNASETYEESTSILYEAVIKLDSYGLLGDFRVEQIQKLINSGCQKPRFANLLERLYKRFKGGMVDDENKNCLMVGRATFTRIHSETSFIKKIIQKLDESGLFDIFLSFLGFVNWLELNYKILFILFCISTLPFWVVFTPLWILFAFAATIEYYSPFSFLDSRTKGDMQFGYCHAHYHPPSIEYNPSKGWVWTMGDNGVVNYKGPFYGQLYKIYEPSIIGRYIYCIGATNFSGIKIKGLLGGYSYFIGNAISVALGPEYP